MLLKWQSIILNRIYQTSNFDKIVLKSTNIDQIDYSQSIDIFKQTTKIDVIDMHSQLIKANQFVQLAHLLCKSKNMQQKREKILFFNKLMPDINQHIQNNKPSFNIFHVILFSSLSKCTIWPSMFKTSKAMVPLLIQFYNRFFNSYTQYLQYKFDPLILSSKYSRLVKQIKEKKLAHPELFQAVQTNNIEKIRDIINNGEENLLNQCMKNCRYITHVAATHSSLQIIRALFELKANFQLLDEQQQTPLFYAVKRFDLEIIKFLVQVAKVEINHKQYQNRTPIYLAAFQGKLQIVNYLYSMGGNPQIESKLARTPLSKACYLGNVEVAQFLIKLGVKLESVDSKGRTALHNAAWGIEGGREGKRRGHIKLQDSPECVELLIKAGHRIDFQDNDKFTPLFSAISSHAEKSLRILLKHGANLKHKTIKNQTAVFIACKYGHLKILRILVQQYNCDYFQQNFEGYSPLMATLTLQSNECFVYMLNLYVKKGIKFNLTLRAIQCVNQFDKWDNLYYLLDWIKNINDKSLTTQQKYIHIAQSFEDNCQQILEFIFASKNDKNINIFLSLIKQVHVVIHRKVVTILMQKLQKYQFINDKAIQIMLNQHNQGFVIPYITLNHFITEQTMIKLLQVDSNLTQSQDTLYHTFIEVIKQRLTKVLIFLINIISQTNPLSKKEGINKYNKQQLLGIVYGKNNNKISLIDYSVVNGYYDIHKIFSNFYNQNYEVGDLKFQQRPVIPKYRYQVRQLKNPIKSHLMPIKDPKAICNFEHLYINFLNEKQKQLYARVSKDITEFKIDHLIVKSIQHLEQMKNHLDSHHLIGIDVEHYSTNKESFICLIQIATLQRAFIIDRFSYIFVQISNYLKHLFLDEQKIKIFHSYDNDLKWLVQNYQIQEFHSVIDTSRIFGLIQNQKGYTPSLKTLAQKYLNLKINKQYQRSDWRIRPLFSEMIDYAATDAKVLPYLLLRMVQSQQLKLANNKLQNLLIIKSMENKRMIKSSCHANVIQII